MHEQYGGADMDNSSITETIHQFFEGNWDGATERRSELRKSFYRPVTVSCESGEEYTAFTRDLSAHGMRLIHRCAIPTGPIQIDIQLSTAKSIRVAADLVWCGEFQGHFASGVRFREELRT